MSKRSTYRSEQEGFEKYFGDDLSEQERHQMERLALEDGFEAEAMEGWEEVSVDTAKSDLSDLRKQLAPEKRNLNWLKIAAAVALLILASWVVLDNIFREQEMLAQDHQGSDPKEEARSNAKIQANEPSTTDEVTAPVSIEEEVPGMVEENIAPETGHDLIATNNTDNSDQGFNETNRTPAPSIQAKSEVTESLVASELDVSEIDIVESEMEPPVQVLAAEGQDKDAVSFRSDEQVYSVTADDLFEIKSKDDWSFRQIRGNIIDEEGQIVSDAQIVLNGTSILAISDLNGAFEMAVPDSMVSPSLTFSSSGFNPLNYSITHSDSFNVVMARDDQPDLSANLLSPQATRKRSKVIADETFANDQDFEVATPDGGFKKFEKYLRKNTRIPKEAKRQGIKGTVLISMQVSPTGELFDFKIINGLGAGCDEEAIRVIKEGPPWNPAKTGGEAISFKTEIEVNFN